MKTNARFRLQILIQNSLFVVLLVAIVGSILYLTRDIKTQWDLTQSKRNTLSEASVEVLQGISGPVSITAYATTKDAEGDLRQLIQDFISPYQREKDDLSFEFVDPREDPARAKQAGVRVNGELVVELNGRSANLDTLTEQELTNLMVRLMRSSERQVSTLDGHGEGKLDGRANFDLGDLGEQLTAKGFRAALVNLAVAQDVPDSTSVFVIAAPRVDLLPGEVNRIKRYLEKGGNLLWLIDYDSLRGMEAIAEFLGLDLIDGIAIDPAAGRLKLPAAFALASAYGEHPVTRRSTLTTVFPYARQIAAHENSSFRFTPLVQAAAGGWLETSGLRNAEFDKNNDISGPITVAGAFEREVGDRKQRVIVIGSGKSLSNEYIGLLGNMDLGVNAMNWLAGDDSLITIQPKTRVDLTLELSRTALLSMSLGFLILLPLGLLIAGGAIWWKRRKS